MAGLSIRPTGNTPVALSHLATLEGVSVHSGDSTVEVTGVALADSQVRPGDLFVALPGARQHGVNFAASAIDHGAVAILTDQAGVTLLGKCPVPVLLASKPREVMGMVSRVVYDPHVPLPQVLAVTGTNGENVSGFLHRSDLPGTWAHHGTV